MGTLVLLGFLCTFLVTDALRCSNCYPIGSCSSANCSVGETVCRTIQNTDHIGGNEEGFSTEYYRGCVAARACKPFSFTLTTLVSIFSFPKKLQMRVVSSCCETDDCNENVRLGGPPVGNIDNGLQCPNGGVATTNQGEKKNLYTTCKGIEDRCIALFGYKTSTEKMSLLGCATKNACDLKANDEIIFDSYIFTLTEDAKCSSGNRLATCCKSPAFLLSLIGFLLVKIQS